ncbi:MAG: ANTAR domain-containing response regulator [Rhodospirillaceae bacterium]
MLRILLVDDKPDRSLDLRFTLERLGHSIVAEIANAMHLHDAVRDMVPDAIIIVTDTPTRNTLGHLCLVTRSCPRPIVMFTQDAKRESIHEAVRSGVTAYVVDGLAAERIQPIIEAAVARFNLFQSVHAELAETRRKLSERKLIDRAKGLLMKEKNISEDEAYRLLRKLAMDKSVTMSAVCEQVISVARLLA